MENYEIINIFTTKYIREEWSGQEEEEKKEVSDM